MVSQGHGAGSQLRRRTEYDSTGDDHEAAVTFGQPMDFSRVGRSEGPPARARRDADAMPDGQRLIGLTSRVSEENAAAARSMTVVLNWFDEVRQRVPRK